jgi:hypothetical protein
MATKQKTQAKPEPKGKAKAPAPVSGFAPKTPLDNRYGRAAKVLLAEGEGMDLAELAVKAQCSLSMAKYCMEAFKGVTAALRDAKLLQQKAAPEKAPVAPTSSPKAAQAAEEANRVDGSLTVDRLPLTSAQ